MTYEEWENQSSKIPLWQFLKIIHGYTELAQIYVVIGDAWIEERRSGGRRNLQDFYLTEDAFRRREDGSYHWPEVERLLKYYANAPLWNVCGCFTEKPWHHYEYNGRRLQGRHVTSCVMAHVYFKDIRDAWYREQADIQRKKRREYDRKRREEKKNGSGRDSNS